MYLSNEKEWKKFIDSIYFSYNELDGKNHKEELKNLLIKTIHNLGKDKQFGIQFSGGLDSSFIALICKELKLKFKCYTVGIKNAPDLEYALMLASKLNLDLKLKIYSLQEIEEILKNVVKLLKNTDVTNVAVGCVNYASLQLAKEDKIKYMFSGSGSEEIYAGYERHLKSYKQGHKEAHEECFNGLKNMWQRDLERDLKLSNYYKIKYLLPFLDKEVIKESMKIHPKFKISKDSKKLILREIAYDLGLKREIAYRPKKASQYGSSFIKAIDKIARKNNFKYKLDYIRSLK